MILEITFPKIHCKNCGTSKTLVMPRGSRYGIYCEDCTTFIKWASAEERLIINTRLEWLKNRSDKL